MDVLIICFEADIIQYVYISRINYLLVALNLEVEVEPNSMRILMCLYYI